MKKYIDDAMTFLHASVWGWKIRPILLSFSFYCLSGLTDFPQEGAAMVEEAVAVQMEEEEEEEEEEDGEDGDEEEEEEEVRDAAGQGE